MASEPSTIALQPKTLARNEVVVTPKETAISAVTRQANPVVVTVLTKHIRIPIGLSMTQSTVATKDIPKEPQG